MNKKQGYIEMNQVIVMAKISINIKIKINE